MNRKRPFGLIHAKYSSTEICIFMVESIIYVVRDISGHCGVRSKAMYCGTVERWIVHWFLTYIGLNRTVQFSLLWCC